MKDCKTCVCYNCATAKDTKGECNHCEECKAGEAKIETCVTGSKIPYES